MDWRFRNTLLPSPKRVEKQEFGEDMSHYTIRHDPKRCISCGACELHCQNINQTPAEVLPGVLITIGPDQVDETVQVISAFRPCFHCEKPWCVAICPTGAIVKRKEDGLVVVIRELCVGCRACITACPWHVPQLNEMTGKMVKCDGCSNRVDAGQLPACVSACTTHALSFTRPNETARKSRQRYAKSCLIDRK